MENWDCELSLNAHGVCYSYDMEQCIDSEVWKILCTSIGSNFLSGIGKHRCLVQGQLQELGITIKFGFLPGSATSSPLKLGKLPFQWAAFGTLSKTNHTG